MVAGVTFSNMGGLQPASYPFPQLPASDNNGRLDDLWSKHREQILIDALGHYSTINGFMDTYVAKDMDARLSLAESPDKKTKYLIFGLVADCRDEHVVLYKKVYDLNDDGTLGGSSSRYTEVIDPMQRLEFLATRKNKEISVANVDGKPLTTIASKVLNVDRSYPPRLSRAAQNMILDSVWSAYNSMIMKYVFGDEKVKSILANNDLKQAKGYLSLGTSEDKELKKYILLTVKGELADGSYIVLHKYYPYTDGKLVDMDELKVATYSKEQKDEYEVDGISYDYELPNTNIGAEPHAKIINFRSLNKSVVEVLR